MKEWKLITDIVTEQEQNQKLEVDLDGEYKEIFMYFSYPKVEANTADKTLLIMINDTQKTGAANWLQYKWALGVGVHILAFPLLMDVSMIRHDEKANWFTVNTTRIEKNLSRLSRLYF